MANKLNSSAIKEFCSAKMAIVPLRIVASFMLIYLHGWPKLMKIIEGNFQFANPIGIGAELSLILACFAEFLCALLVLVGFYTRAASVILMINFAVAILFVHVGMAFSTFEPAVLYFVIFLTTFLVGPGKFSIDEATNGAATGRSY